MNWVMPSLTRKKNGTWIARQAIPEDVRSVYKRHYNVQREARFTAPAGTSQAKAAALHGEWVAEVKGRISAIRAGLRGEGIDLSHKDALALAGEWYTWFVARYEDAPGDPERWDGALRSLIDQMEAHAPPEVRERPWHDLSWTRDPDVRDGIRPVLADMGHTTQFLASKGIALTNEAQARFLNAVLDNYIEALVLLERRARGDYEPDELPKQFPKFTGHKRTSATVQSPWKLFEGWVKAKQPADRTVNRWRVVFQDLESKFPDAGELTDDAAQTWARGCITPKRSARTVKDVWVNSASTVFAYAKAERLITHNPFADVTVTVPRKIKTRDTDAFTSEEAQAILRASLSVTATATVFAAAKRWVPWLCAYSGARVGEIAQLRGSDIQERQGFHVMRLTPEAGTIKTRQPRTVPLHEHIIEQGFLDHVQRWGKGPLFYNIDSKDKSGDNDPMNPKRPRAVVTANRLGSWVRTIGVDHPEVQPNHAWRDTFKQIAERHGISERIHDAITGHSAKTSGRTYGMATPEDMAAALQKFPRYRTEDT